MLFVAKVILLLLASSLNAPWKSNPLPTPGSVVYSFSSGRMECQSEIDSSGRLVVLLKGLSDNTTLEFQKFWVSEDKEFVVSFLMAVLDDKICRGWIDLQEVTMVVQPKPTSAITLSGKVVFSSDQVTVMVPEGSCSSVAACVEGLVAG